MQSIKKSAVIDRLSKFKIFISNVAYAYLLWILNFKMFNKVNSLNTNKPLALQAWLLKYVKLHLCSFKVNVEFVN